MSPKIKERIKNERKYFSYVYSYREKNQIKHIEKGIGYHIPSSDKLELIKDQFLIKVFEKRWKKEISLIKHNYNKKLGNYNQESLIKEYRSFGINFTYESNKIEGSTMSYRDTSMLLEHHLTPSNKNITDVLETKRHMEVYQSLLDINEEISLNLIKKWHKELFKDTKKEHAGIFRNNAISRKGTKGVNVVIIGSLHKPPSFEKLEGLMNDLILWYYEKKKKYNPVLLAGLFHLKFSIIHPFVDGNGRMSRLINNYILHKNGYPMLNIRYIQRRGYYSSLENSSVEDQNEMHFINWYMRKYISAYKKN
ncbi:MAG: Fic family protein [Promethearchaeota archaeon]